MKEILRQNSRMADPQSWKLRGSDGFSLLEAIIALVILMIAVLGVFGAFTYSIKFNSGNNRRSQALSVFQTEVEVLRSAKFTPTVVDASLTGGIKAARTVSIPGSGDYLVEEWVDDNPTTPNTVDINPATTLKEITIQVTPPGTEGKWVTASKARMILRRVRAN
jgi:type II secretory pathway pseudopilin PulG